MNELHTTPFLFLFLAMLLISTLMRLYLSQRQIRFVSQHREKVPESFADNISLEDHQKAADYTISKVKFGHLPLFYDAALLLIWTLGGGLDWLDKNLIALELGPILTGIGVILVYTFISSLLDLPFSLYNTFVIEEKFGFNRTTIKTFITDMIKGSLLGLIIGIPLLYVILWLMEQSGDQWWVYAWLVISGFSIFMMWVYPTWIAPIFNKFEPLEEGETLSRITQLLNRCGFSSNGIFVIDGSKRSSHGNAYFSGFGRNKRIVFFDTLLKMLSDDELEAAVMLRDKAAQLEQCDGDVSAPASMAKYYAGETAVEAVNSAIRIVGSHGCYRDTPFERLLRDVKALEIAGGTPEIMKNIIATAILGKQRKF